MHSIIIAWRLLRREWRSGELNILIIALLIAVASVTSIDLFTQRVHQVMHDQTGRFLGGDLLLRSPRAIDNKLIEKAQSAYALKTSPGLIFSSVIVANNEFQLAQVKAVDDHYPLRGEISISEQLQSEEIKITQGPKPNEVWLSPRLFHSLNIKVGDQIELGKAYFKVTAVLRNDPGQTGGFIAFAPALLMHVDDIEKTGIVQPGSRVIHTVLFAGAAEQRKAYEKWLKPKLNPSQKLFGGASGAPALNAALNRADQYLSLASMLSVVLAGIAIALAANRYGKRHYDQSALMRCFGASQQTLLSIYTAQLIIIGLLSSIAGVIIGWLAQQGLAILLADFIPGDLPTPPITALFTGLFTGLIVLAGFALPAILRLKSVSPLRILRRDLPALTGSSYLVYAMALGSLVVLMWWQSQNLLLTFIVLAGFAACMLLIMISAHGMIHLCKKLIPLLPYNWRNGMQHIVRFQTIATVQLMALSLGLIIVITIFLVRTDLIQQWQNKLPDNTPNHFIINIQNYELDAIRAFFSQHNLQSENFYPMSRGRIVSLNDMDITEAVEEQAKNDESLRRELNLSWTDQLPENNKILDGRWWQPSDDGQHLISVEQGLAQRLGIKISDKLGFQIGDQLITATVISIRSVQWDSFQPNFYVIFPPQTLEHLPASYITSFHLSLDNKQLLNQLVKNFSGITVIEIDAIMRQVKLVLDQATLAIEYVMLFVLAASLIVLVASIYFNLDERLHSAVIMRTLGARNHFIRSSQMAEFILLGAIATLLAIIMSELIAFGLFTQVFDLDYRLHPWLWIVTPVFTIPAILLAGMLTTRRVLRLSPTVMLRSSQIS
ncbi:MAG TPA: FtsX-like permease family protein [Gammaproteobacteria bacterium]